MEDSFKLRVDRVFGSLSTSTSENLNSLWSLTDDEIERKEWNRDKDEPEAEAQQNAFFANLRDKKPDSWLGEELEKDILELDDGLDEEETEACDSLGSSSRSAASVRGEDYNDEEWEIKSKIGADCTLDKEEEEDQYDKVAIGKEKPTDRLYMKDINDYETDADSFNELPNSLSEATRDPRANHVAAKIRLKEDAEAAKKIDSLRVSEKDTPSDVNAHVYTSEDVTLKPILKRGDTSDSRPQKRVRFDSACKDNSESKDDFGGKTEEDLSNVAFPLPPGYPSGIPDYMRNPSKYTHYTFDSDDMDDKSNRQAYMDFLNMIKRSKTAEPEPEDNSLDLTKTVTFIPRRKTGDATMADSDMKSKQNQDSTSKDSVHRRGLPIAIAAEVAEDEACAMEEDEPETAANKITGSQRPGRQYRMRDWSDME